MYATNVCVKHLPPGFLFRACLQFRGPLIFVLRTTVQRFGPMQMCVLSADFLINNIWSLKNFVIKIRRMSLPTFYTSIALIASFHVNDTNRIPHSSKANFSQGMFMARSQLTQSVKMFFGTKINEIIFVLWFRNYELEGQACGDL